MIKVRNKAGELLGFVWHEDGKSTGLPGWFFRGENEREGTANGPYLREEYARAALRRAVAKADRNG